MTLEPRPDIPALRLGLAQSVAHWGKYRAAETALIVGTERLSYSDLDQLATDVHGRVSAIAEPGARVGIVVDSKVSFVSTLIGVIRAGCTGVICPSSWSQEQLGQVIHDNTVRLLVLDVDRSELKCADGAPVGCIKVPLQYDASPTARTTCRRLATSDWAVLFSSGTTGRPKGIVRNDLSILNELIGWCLELSLGRTTQFYVGRPLFYTGGLVLAASTLLVGGCVISPTTHTPDLFVRLCGEHHPNYAFLLPSQIEELVAFAKGHAISPLNTTILSMGAFIEPDLKREAIARLGCAFIESWGNSEGLGTIAWTDDSVTRTNSIGRPFLGDELLITDEQGNALPYGNNGRLSGRADSCLSYYQSRDDLNRCLIKGDLVISEDVGYQDAQGYFYLVARVSDLVSRAGTTVNLREIERHANRLEEVRTSCAVALSTASAITRIIVAVELRPDSHIDCAKTKELLNAALPPSHFVDGVTVVAELCRNAAGKVNIESVRASMEATWKGLA